MLCLLILPRPSVPDEQESKYRPSTGQHTQPTEEEKENEWIYSRSSTTFRSALNDWRFQKKQKKNAHKKKRLRSFIANSEPKQGANRHATVDTHTHLALHSVSTHNTAVRVHRLRFSRVRLCIPLYHILFSISSVCCYCIFLHHFFSSK